MGYIPSYIKSSLLLVLLVFSISMVKAQQAIYVPNKARVFFVGDTATAFSDIINKGKLGIGKKAVLHFKGKKWENDPGALITDDAGLGDTAKGEGGIVIFSNEFFRQQLDAGYNQAIRQGSGFSKLYIDNIYGVELVNSTAYIRQTLHFTRGLFYLQSNMLVLGENNPGIISGYDSKRFIVAGRANSGAALIRRNIRRADGIVHFPLGSNEKSYAPAAIRSHAVPGDDFYVTVFDTVLANVTRGRILNDLGVNKTWQIGKLQRPGRDRADIYLQHALADEGESFRKNRVYSYISSYTGSHWDTAGPKAIPVPGTIGAGAPDPDYGMNTRGLTTAIGSSSWFTKFAVPADSALKTKYWFQAYRNTWSSVHVYWSTMPELNLHYFVVQRRFGSDPRFSNTDTVFSKALNGYSLDQLNYSLNDPNSYEGITYYRLMLVDYAGDISYSNEVPVGNRPGGSGLIVWPNPNRGRFFAGINGDTRVQSLVIFNALGQKIMEEKVNNRNIIELNLRIPGSYFLSFVGVSGNFIETKKILIPEVY